MFIEEIEKKIERAEKDWMTSNTGNFDDIRLLQYICTLKLIKDIDVDTLANVSQITNTIDTLKGDLHSDLLSIAGKLDNINSKLSSIDSKVSSANTLLTQIEANTK